MSDRDFLSYALSLLRVNSSSIFLFDFGAPWGIETDDIPIPVSWTVMEGGLWMIAPNSEPVALNRGDTLLLPRGIRGKSYAFLSSLDVKPIGADDLFRQAHIERFEPDSIIERPMYVRGGGDGASTRVVSAAFGFDVRRLGPLLATLPEVMIVRAIDSGPEFVDVVLRNLMETNFEQPGFSALATHTAQLLLVHVIRIYALAGSESEIGWLAGLGDRHIARALMSIHREPEHDWSVASLARGAGLSRSGFAKRFLARTGKTPMEYLRSWRMQLAQEALASGEVTVTTLAQNLGYQSDAAFREAFRRTTGQTPREFRRQSVSRDSVRRPQAGQAAS